MTTFGGNSVLTTTEDKTEQKRLRYVLCLNIYSSKIKPSITLVVLHCSCQQTNINDLLSTDIVSEIEVQRCILLFFLTDRSVGSSASYDVYFYFIFFYLQIEIHIHLLRQQDIMAFQCDISLSVSGVGEKQRVSLHPWPWSCCCG